MYPSQSILRKGFVLTLSSAPRARVSELHQALWLALLFASAKFLIHFAGNLWQAHLGWGLWRDEMYYLACGQHLAWGYVDHGPLVALQARLAVTLFGRSLAAIRIFVALAGAARVFLTGLLAFRLGGRRPAQVLAMTTILVAPAYLGGDSVLNMGPFESVFWMACLLVLLDMQTRLGIAPLPSTAASNTGVSLSLRGRLTRSLVSFDPALASLSLAKPWIVFGLLAGLGLLNKPSMAFFLLALGLALVSTRVGRILLLRRAALLGLALIALVTAPNLLWQIQNHWPTLEFLQNDKMQGKNGPFLVLEFLGAPVFAFIPATLAIWAAGVICLLRRSRTRYLGWTYLLFLGLMMAVTAKDYYTFPIYPLLFAAGSVAWERLFGSWWRARALAIATACIALVAVSIIPLPTLIPVFTPADWLRYTAKHKLYLPPSDLSNASPLPYFFAERSGWREEAAEVRRIVASLSPTDRAQLAILCENYGEAGALRFYAPELPPALAGQNSFYLWGFGHTQGKILLFITNRTPEDLHRFYGEVTVVGNLDHNPYMLPFERHRLIYLLRDPHQDMATFWRTLKSFI